VIDGIEKGGVAGREKAWRVGEGVGSRRETRGGGGWGPMERRNRRPYRGVREAAERTWGREKQGVRMGRDGTTVASDISAGAKDFGKGIKPFRAKRNQLWGNSLILSEREILCELT